MIAGKGHETGQIVGGDILPFDDAAVAREALGSAGRAMMRRRGLSPCLDAAMPSRSGRVGRVGERLCQPATLCEP